MPAIPKKEAMEKLAQAVGGASFDYLAAFYDELFPEKALPKAATAKVLVDEITSYIRTKIEPEELVSLWHVAFPADRHVHYDEEEGMIRYNEEEPWYTER
jgi:hypothetical protein